MGNRRQRTRPRARLAYLLMHEGEWDGKRIFTASWIRRFTTSAAYFNMKSNVSCGWGEQYPKDLYRITGSGINLAVIVPSLDLVATFNGRTPNHRRDEVTAEFLRRLFAAVTQQYLTCDGRVVNGNNNQTRSVSRLRLIDAERDQPIMDLTQGMTSTLANLPTQNLNIQAVTVPSIVGSVRFALDGTTNYRTETGAPYALAGDNAGDYGSTWWPRSTGGRRTLSASGDRDVFEEAFRGGDRAVRNL